MSRSSNVEIQIAESLDFTCFEAICGYVHEISRYKTSSQLNEINESVKESNAQIDKII